METRVIVFVCFCIFVCGLVFSTGAAPAQLPGALSPAADPPAADSTDSPSMRFVPPLLKVQPDSAYFVDREISILNSGGSPLRIRKVQASCYCASALVLTREIVPFSVGKMRLRINADKFTDSVTTVHFTVYSNAPDSMRVYKVYVRKP